jgi:4-diphosphocytidyl-2-C-methyl-D-erythritol kinase
VKPLQPFSIEAPCKVNLHLSIGEKRPDGYHSLESIFAVLSLVDTLSFERHGKEGDFSLEINWETTGEAIPTEKNLVFRAVSLFREQTGFTKGLKVCLDKRIPAGAGLGGGSSDAASTLMALNHLSELALPMESLAAMAVLLGSDVPFFLRGGAAFVSGRGELIEPVEPPVGLWAVLVKPPFPSDTSTAFRLLDERRASIKRFRYNPVPKGSLIKALKSDPETWPFFNDFLPLFLDSGEKIPMAAAYRTIPEKLRALGASFTGLSGTGSSCFGIFKKKEAAEKAAKALGGGENHTKFTFFLARNAKVVLK